MVGIDKTLDDLFQASEGRAPGNGSVSGNALNPAGRNEQERTNDREFERQPTVTFRDEESVDDSPSSQRSEEDFETSSRKFADEESLSSTVYSSGGTSNSSRKSSPEECSSIRLPEPEAPDIEELREDFKQQRKDFISLSEENQEEDDKEEEEAPYNGNTQHQFISSERLRFEVEALLPRTEHVHRPVGSFRVLRNASERNGFTQSELAQIEKRLPEDSFSFILTAATGSIPFLYAALIGFFQFSVYVLVCISVVDTNNKVNPCSFPSNVEPSTRIAQLIALVILIPLQDEVLEALILMNDGYDGRKFETKFENATKMKFAASLAMRLCVGLLSVMTSFLLIMIEEDVLNIFFNFIALQFINDLDNLAFRFAAEGILGIRMQTEATQVSDTSYFSDRLFHRHLPLIGLFVVVIGCWGWVVSLQRNGKFVSESIEVQFGDDIVPELGTFSGLFYRDKIQSRSGRFHYIDPNPQSRAFFGFCDEIPAWTFVIEGDDPCEFVARSETTDTYEVSATFSWSVGNPRSTLVPLVPFFIACFWCADQSNPCRHGGVYSSSDHFCRCPVGRFGQRCEFVSPCLELTLDTSHGSFRGPIELPTEFNAVKHPSTENIVTFQSKPVYVDLSLRSLLIIFNGRRWMATSVFDFNVTSVDGLLDRLEQGVQLYYTPVRSTFLSESIDIGSANDQATPVGKRFYRSTNPLVGLQKPIYDEMQLAHFDCRTCDTQLYPCKFGNPCVDGVCICADGSTGHQCQIGPWGDGRCDDSFNSFDFTFDAGDCCQGSCVSTFDNFCGYDGRVEVGFPSCVDSAFSCKGGVPCWAANAAPFDMPRFAGAAAHKATVKLASNGRVAAISYPHLDRVQVLDHVDSEWVQRGLSILGPPQELFGERIALSTKEQSHGSILDSVVAPVGVRLAIGTHKGRRIRIVDWFVDRWLAVGPDISFPDSSTVFAFDLFGQGRNLVVQIDSRVEVYDIENMDQKVSNSSCLELARTQYCSLASVSEDGALLLISSNGETIFVASKPGDPSPNATIISTTASTSVMSKDGTVIGTFDKESDQAYARFLGLQDGGVWAQLGENIVMDDENSRFSSLSADGKHVAFIGGVEGQETVQVFNYRDGSWSALGNKISAAALTDASISYDASVVGVTDASGRFRSYYHSPRCRDGESEYRFFFILERGQEIEWSLVSVADNSSLFESPRYSKGPLKILQTMCLPQEGLCANLHYGTTPLDAENDSLLSVRTGNAEVVTVSPTLSNGTFQLGHC